MSHEVRGHLHSLSAHSDIISLSDAAFLSRIIFCGLKLVIVSMQLTYILGVIESFETEARSAEDQQRAAFTSGSDSSLEKCLPVASRFFVVRSPCQEDEAILSCDSDRKS